MHFSTIARVLPDLWENAGESPLFRFTFSSGLLAALLDLPAADSGQGNEQHEQAHSQANRYPQSHWGECNVLTWREWKKGRRRRRESLIIHSCRAKIRCTTVTLPYPSAFIWPFAATDCPRCTTAKAGARQWRMITAIIVSVISLPNSNVRSAMGLTFRAFGGNSSFSLCVCAALSVQWNHLRL